MPIYDYACDACEERFEELVRADAAPPPCPSCGADETQRLLSPFAFPNGVGGQRRYTRSFPIDACCGGGGCGTHAG